MRHLLKLSIFTAIVCSMAGTAFAEKKTEYKLVVRYGGSHTSWSGPAEHDGASHIVDESSTEIPIINGKLLDEGKELIKRFDKTQRIKNVETTKRVVALADAYARSHHSTKVDSYTRTHTTGTVQHNHSGGITQGGSPCGTYGCSCEDQPRRTVYRCNNGGRSGYGYYCPTNSRWFYSWNTNNWNWRYYRIW